MHSHTHTQRRTTTFVWRRVITNAIAAIKWTKQSKVQVPDSNTACIFRLTCSGGKTITSTVRGTTCGWAADQMHFSHFNTKPCGGWAAWYAACGVPLSCDCKIYSHYSCIFYFKYFLRQEQPFVKAFVCWRGKSSNPCVHYTRVTHKYAEQPSFATNLLKLEMQVIFTRQFFFYVAIANSYFFVLLLMCVFYMCVCDICVKLHLFVIFAFVSDIVVIVVICNRVWGRDLRHCFAQVKVASNWVVRLVQNESLNCYWNF